jgi:hypothetical protein
MDEGKQNTGLNRLFDLLTRLIPMAGVFGALLYFVGRRYTEGYLNTIGVPPHLLNYGVADYMFQGAQPWRLLIVLIFVFLGFLLYRFGMPESSPWGGGFKIELKRMWHQAKTLTVSGEIKVGGIFMLFFMLGYYPFIVVLLILFAIGFFGPNNLALQLVLLFLSAIAVGFAILILTDRNSTSIMKSSSVLAWSFFVTALVVFFIFPYIVAGSYGVVSGVLDTGPNNLGRSFQEVQLTAEKPIAGFEWEQQDNGLWRTKDKLYVLASSNENLFIRSEGNDTQTMVIPTDRILSFSLSVIPMSPLGNSSLPKGTPTYQGVEPFH